MNNTDVFTAQQAASANTALRSALGLPAQNFSAEQFVGMISEEIEQLRAAGRTDDDIAQLLKKEVGVELDADLIGRYYADAAERSGHP